MEHENKKGFLQIRSNIEHIRKHLLSHKMAHMPDYEEDGKCKYCGKTNMKFDPAQICKIGTQETQRSAEANIEGGELLIELIKGLKQEEDRTKILGFLSQSLHIRY